MHIRIDATSLLLRSGGIKSYTWHWLRHLQSQAASNTLIDAFPFVASAPATLDHERSPFPALPTYARLAALYGVNIGGPAILDQFLRGVDIFHCSNQVRVAPRRCRITATIHDMTCWLMPEVHTEANVHADASFAREILKRAARLIAVSENTRQDAIRILNLDPDRIETIYSGVDDRFFNAEPARRDRPYVLFLGTIEPRKNMDTLLDAWALLPADLRHHHDLLIAGPAGWHSETTMARLADPSSGAKYLGYVPEHDIPSLTAGATVFAYVSRYEGFGFPVAQAMAAGVPVITSNSSCLPEVAGEGGVFVDPRSPAEIAKALKRLLTDGELRKQLGEAGRNRAARLFRWEECARRSLAFFGAVY